MILRINIGGTDFQFANPAVNFAFTLRLANENCPPYQNAPQTYQYANWGNYFDAVVNYIKNRVTNWGNSRLINAQPDGYDGNQKPGYQGFIEIDLDDAFFERTVGYCQGAIVVCPYTSDNPKFQAVIPMEFEYRNGETSTPARINPSILTTAPTVNDKGGTTVSTNKTPTVLNIQDGGFTYDAKGNIINQSAVFAGTENIEWEKRSVVIAVRDTPGFDAQGNFVDTFRKDTVIGYADGIEGGIARVFTFQNKVLLFVNDNDVRYQ